MVWGGKKEPAGICMMKLNYPWQVHFEMGVQISFSWLGLFFSLSSILKLITFVLVREKQARMEGERAGVGRQGSCSFLTSQILPTPLRLVSTSSPAHSAPPALSAPLLLLLIPLPIRLLYPRHNDAMQVIQEKNSITELFVSTICVLLVHANNSWVSLGPFFQEICKKQNFLEWMVFQKYKVLMQALLK